MRIRTQTRTHNQIVDQEEWRNKVLLGISLGGGVQTNGPPDVCVFVSTGDHVWVCARGMVVYFESDNDCVSVPWRRKSLVSVSSHSKHRSVYLSNYQRPLEKSSCGPLTHACLYMRLILNACSDPVV
jgi:hypothetical protein